jgi:hypothetical protein
MSVESYLRACFDLRPSKSQVKVASLNNAEFRIAQRVCRLCDKSNGMTHGAGRSDSLRRNYNSDSADAGGEVFRPLKASSTSIYQEDWRPVTSIEECSVLQHIPIITNLKLHLNILPSQRPNPPSRR